MDKVEEIDGHFLCESARMERQLTCWLVVQSIQRISLPLEKLKINAVENLFLLWSWCWFQACWCQGRGNFL